MLVSAPTPFPAWSCFLLLHCWLQIGLKPSLGDRPMIKPAHSLILSITCFIMAFATHPAMRSNSSTNVTSSEAVQPTNYNRVVTKNTNAAPASPKRTPKQTARTEPSRTPESTAKAETPEPSKQSRTLTGSQCSDLVWQQRGSGYIPPECSWYLQLYRSQVESRDRQLRQMEAKKARAGQAVQSQQQQPPKTKPRATDTW